MKKNLIVGLLCLMAAVPVFGMQDQGAQVDEIINNDIELCKKALKSRLDFDAYSRISKIYDGYYRNMGSETGKQKLEHEIIELLKPYIEKVKEGESQDRTISRLQQLRNITMYNANYKELDEEMKGKIEALIEEKKSLSSKINETKQSIDTHKKHNSKSCIVM